MRSCRVRPALISGSRVVLILGCGYTGIRVARFLAARGHRVVGTHRTGHRSDPGIDSLCLDLPGPLDFSGLPADLLVLHSIPTIDGVEYTSGLLEALGRRPAHLVYLSTTGVYGATRDVDENTAPNPATEREWLRFAAERAVLDAPYPTLVLRPAAIYGPGRGIHVSLPEGRFRLSGEGQNFVSRIHVDDLAAMTAEALLTDVTGAYPVADEHPCTALEIARYCSELLRAPMPAGAAAGTLHETRRADRRVDGRAICRLLGVSLRYPSYREGIPASLE
jgi:nucleoside-diphosphate-sugar epimerase